MEQGIGVYYTAMTCGIVRLNKRDHTLTVECWPRYADPARDSQYPGWPMTIHQTDKYGRRPAAHLPVLAVHGLERPVVQVISDTDGDAVYTLRLSGSRFRPGVFAPGACTVRVGDPDRGAWKTLSGLEATHPPDEAAMVKVTFDLAP